MKKRKSRKYYIVFAVIIFVVVLCCAFFGKDESPATSAETNSSTSNSVKTTSSQNYPQTDFTEIVSAVSLSDIPAYSGKSYVVVNNNEPTFDKSLKPQAFEKYSKLDSLGRCGTAFACVCKETMPTEPREPIYSVKPTGWVHTDYDFIDGKSLFNRCHLIGFQLTAENANERNLITGTRYMNTEMNKFENMTADYIKETGNHVLYMVTPIFKDKELVARGVQMQAYSVEDEGDGICFNVYFYNVQPKVTINYSNGDNHLAQGVTTTTTKPAEIPKCDYVLNVKTHKFHCPDCKGVADMSEKNKKEYNGSRDKLIEEGYIPCGSCNP